LLLGTGEKGKKIEVAQKREKKKQRGIRRRGQTQPWPHAGRKN